jgi:hypothetical protein
MTRARSIFSLAAIALVTLGAGVPLMAQAAPSEGEEFIVEYQGTLTTTMSYSGLGDAGGEYGPHVETDQDDAYPGSVQCVGERCTLGYARDVYSPEVVLVGGEAEVAVPGDLGVCTDTFTYDPQPAVTIQATATAETLTYSVVQDFGGTFVDCSDGTRRETVNYRYEFSGTYVAGETCALLGAPCPDFGEDFPVEDAGAPLEPSAFAESPFGTTVGYGNDVSRLAESPGDAAAPSVLSGLPSMVVAAYTPGRTVIAALLAAAATAVVGLSLLGSQSIAAGGQQIAGKFPWLKAVGKRLRRVTGTVDAAARAAVSGPPVKVWLVVAATYVVGVLLSALVDPGAGPNAGTARLLASLLTVFLLQSVLGWAVIRAILGRGGRPVEFRPTINPGLLLLVVAGAVFSRVLGFEPGVIFGALLGLAFGATLQGARQAKVVLVGSGFLVALSFVSWVTYSIGAAAGWQASGFGVFALETLSGLTVAGASGLAVALLPHKAFDGKIIWDWRKLVWAAVYAGGAFYALVVLGAIPIDPSAISAPLLGWLVLYLVYGAVSLALWLIARRAARPPAAPAETRAPSAAV